MKNLTFDIITESVCSTHDWKPVKVYEDDTYIGQFYAFEEKEVQHIQALQKSIPQLLWNTENTLVIADNELSLDLDLDDNSTEKTYKVSDITVKITVNGNIIK